MRTCHVRGYQPAQRNPGPLVLQGGHHNRADVVSSLVLRGAPDDSGRFCQRDPLANQATGDVANRVGRADQRGEE